MVRNTTDRRSLMGSGLAVLLLAAAATGDAKAQELDGELLRLCTDYQSLATRIENIGKDWDATVDLTVEQDRTFTAKMNIIQGQQAEVMEKIEGIAAATPEGLRAKVLVLEVELQDEMDTDGCFADSRASLAWSLVQDMLGRGA